MTNSIWDRKIATAKKLIDAIHRKSSLLSPESHILFADDLNNLTRIMTELSGGNEEFIASQQKKSAVELEESEEKFRAIIEQFTEGLVMTDELGKIIIWNDAMEEITGFEQQKVLGMFVWDLQYRLGVVPVELEDIKSAIMKMLLDPTFKRSAEPFETVIEKADGERRFVQQTIFHIFSENYNRIGMIMHDITQRKRAGFALQESEERFRASVENLLDGFAIISPMTDSTGKILDFCYEYINDVGCQLNQRSREDTIGHTILEVTPFFKESGLWDELTHLLKNGDSLVKELTLFANDEKSARLRRVIDVRAVKMAGELSLTWRDVTNGKRAEEELRLAREKLISWVTELELRNHEADLMRKMGDLLQVCNSFDEAYTVIQQFAPRLFPGTVGGLFVINHSRRALEAMATWGENIQSEHVFAPEDCWAMRRGQMHSANVTAPGLRCKHILKSFGGNYLGIPMMASGESLGVLHIQCDDPAWGSEKTQELAQSVAEHLALSLSNLRLRETLRSQSIRDVLTGLFNRRYMEESLDRELHRAIRKQTQVGIIMLDIDNFKHFNDTYGHDAGDTVLRELGELLQRQIRGEDIACRYGGEEFILILPDANLQAIEQRANQICEGVRSMVVEHRGKSLGRLTTSMGLAVFPDHGINVKSVLRKADEALYQAKHNGRNCVVTASLPIG